MSERRGRAGDGRREGGFALPVTLLALVVLSLVAAAAVSVARSERRISRNHRASVEALEVARGGLAEYLSTAGDSLPDRSLVLGPDTVRVTSRRLLHLSPDSLASLHLLAVRGVRSRGGGGGPGAERTLATLVLAGPGRPSPAGALAAGGPVRVAAGSSVTADGRDACGGAAGPDATAGVALGPGALHGATLSADGEPPIDDRRAPRELLARSGVDSSTWAALRAGWPAPPDVRATPPGGWPTDFSDWPRIHVEGSAPVLDDGHGGRGTIVAPGDLTLRGRFRWEGLVLVGGALRATDSAVVRGAALAGLGVHAAAAPDTTTLAGSARVRFDACAARRAAAGLVGRLAEKPGARFDPSGR